ncbi:MAG: hypothetical protein OXP69_18760 [Spirochaetaceae bacterium]|nr:hypothetical protein [Spirochaetaceae bacterium]
MARGPAGYSGTPLIRKLGLRPDLRVCLLHEPDGFRALLDGVERFDITADLQGTFDYLQFFTDSRAELEARFPALAGHVADGGMLWISWPKKSSPLAGDLTEDGVRAIGLRTEFVDVKVCAVDRDWSALKFLRRRNRNRQ